LVELDTVVNYPAGGEFKLRAAVETGPRLVNTDSIQIWVPLPEDL
jgi:hypothetical protein